MSIWSDAFLNQLDGDAGDTILNAVECLFHKFYLQIVSGTSVYTLPTKVRTLRSVKYRGIPIDEISWQEYILLVPMAAFANAGNKIEVPLGRPRYYVLHPTNNKEIRFFPTPDENFVTTGDPYSPLANEARCNITCWRTLDDSVADAQLPSYINRRTRKAYILWKAFGKEGKGQDLKAAAYYEKKFKFLIERFIVINTKAFVAKIYSLSDPVRYPYPRRPRLPSQFEPTILH